MNALIRAIDANKPLSGRLAAYFCKNWHKAEVICALNKPGRHIYISRVFEYPRLILDYLDEEKKRVCMARVARGEKLTKIFVEYGYLPVVAFIRKYGIHTRLNDYAPYEDIIETIRIGNISCLVDVFCGTRLSLELALEKSGLCLYEFIRLIEKHYRADIVNPKLIAYDESRRLSVSDAASALNRAARFIYYDAAVVARYLAARELPPLEKVRDSAALLLLRKKVDFAQVAHMLEPEHFMQFGGDAFSQKWHILRHDNCAHLLPCVELFARDAPMVKSTSAMAHYLNLGFSDLDMFRQMPGGLEFEHCVRLHHKYEEISDDLLEHCIKKYEILPVLEKMPALIQLCSNEVVRRHYRRANMPFDAQRLCALLPRLNPWKVLLRGNNPIVSDESLAGMLPAKHLREVMESAAFADRITLLYLDQGRMEILDWITRPSRAVLRRLIALARDSTQYSEQLLKIAWRGEYLELLYAIESNPPPNYAPPPLGAFDWVENWRILGRIRRARALSLK